MNKTTKLEELFKATARDTVLKLQTATDVSTVEECYVNMVILDEIYSKTLHKESQHHMFFKTYAEHLSRLIDEKFYNLLDTIINIPDDGIQDTGEPDTSHQVNRSRKI